MSTTAESDTGTPTTGTRALKVLAVTNLWPVGDSFRGIFVKEQVEEVALMGDLLNVVERSKENLLLAEDYIARENPGEGGGDPTAPPAAGMGE